MSMEIIIGSDHGGFELKEEIKQFLLKQGYKVDDKGCDSKECCDYPIYAKKVADDVIKKKAVGILFCGTGLGMCMTANKKKGIRAAVCYDEFTAEMARQHNDANVLCLGGRTTKKEMAKKIARKFLETPFSNEERHKKRIRQIAEFENAN